MSPLLLALVALPAAVVAVAVVANEVVVTVVTLAISLPSALRTLAVSVVVVVVAAALAIALPAALRTLVALPAALRTLVSVSALAVLWWGTVSDIVRAVRALLSIERLQAGLAAGDDPAAGVVRALEREVFGVEVRPAEVAMRRPACVGLVVELLAAACCAVEVPACGAAVGRARAHGHAPQAMCTTCMHA